MKAFISCLAISLALILASCLEAPDKAPVKQSTGTAEAVTSPAATPSAPATAEYESRDGTNKKYPLSKAFATHLAALVKTKPTTPKPGPRPNAAPAGIITVNGTGYAYFGTLWHKDKEYWDSPQLREFWKFLNSHPAEEIPNFEPAAVAKP